MQLAGAPHPTNPAKNANPKAVCSNYKICTFRNGSLREGVKKNEYFTDGLTVRVDPYSLTVKYSPSLSLDLQRKCSFQFAILGAVSHLIILIPAKLRF